MDSRRGIMQVLPRAVFFAWNCAMFRLRGGDVLGCGSGDERVDLRGVSGWELIAERE